MDRFPARVLVVDDDEDSRLLLCHILGDAGHLVDGAASGREALVRAAQCRPQLALVDVLMPKLDGWTVVRRLRALPEPPASILMSARADVGTVLNSLRAGADAFLPKPFLYPELITICRRLLQRSAPTEPACERRRMARRRFLVPALLGLPDRTTASARVTDLSPSGVHVETESRPEAALPLSLSLPEPWGLCARLTARVRWLAPAGLGWSAGLVFARAGGPS